MLLARHRSEASQPSAVRVFYETLWTRVWAPAHTDLAAVPKRHRTFGPGILTTARGKRRTRMRRCVYRLLFSGLQGRSFGQIILVEEIKTEQIRRPGGTCRAADSGHLPAPVLQLQRLHDFITTPPFLRSPCRRYLVETRRVGGHSIFWPVQTLCVSCRSSTPAPASEEVNDLQACV